MQNIVKKAGFHSIGATICTRRESCRRPYARFYIYFFCPTSLEGSGPTYKLLLMKPCDRLKMPAGWNLDQFWVTGSITNLTDIPFKEHLLEIHPSASLKILGLITKEIVYIFFLHFCSCRFLFALANTKSVWCWES